MMKQLEIGIVGFKRVECLVNLVSFLNELSLLPHVYLDGADCDATAATQTKIVEKLSEFECVLYQNTKNLGLRQNIETACSDLSNKSEVFVLLEDDVKVGYNFLNIVNDISGVLSANNHLASASLCTLPDLVRKDGSLKQSEVFLPWGFVCLSKMWKQYLANRDALFLTPSEHADDELWDFILSKIQKFGVDFEYRADIWSIYWHAYWLTLEHKFLIPPDCFCENIGIGMDGVHNQNFSGIYTPLCTSLESLNTSQGLCDTVFEREARHYFCMHWSKSYLGIK